MKPFMKLTFALCVTFLLVKECQGATIRDTTSGRQINFPENDETDAEGSAPAPKGFIQRIFDMIKNLLGFGTRTTVVHNDGTVEEVEVPSSGGIISRIGKRVLGFINSILGVLTGESSPRLDGYHRYNVPSETSNEIERELMKFAGNQKS